MKLTKRSTPRLPRQESYLLMKEIIKGLSRLRPREEMVLRMRFGIGYEPYRSLKEIAAYFDLTKERIRQIEGVALKKLRNVTEIGWDRMYNTLELVRKHKK